MIEKNYKGHVIGREEEKYNGNNQINSKGFFCLKAGQKILITLFKNNNNLTEKRI